MWGSAPQEDLEVSGGFGTFTIVVRRPKAAEQVRIRGLVMENRIQDLFATYLGLLVNWKGLVDPKGEEIAFNDRTKDEVFSYPEILKAVLDKIDEYCCKRTLEEGAEKKSGKPQETSDT